VILSGGTSKIPRVQKSVFAVFPNAEYLTNLNTDEVIAIGAANQASLVNDKQDFGDYEEKVFFIFFFVLKTQSI
jgi:molecular chaperone DnaK (HSP70)